MSKQVKSCAGKECFERMNYLYQASKLIANLALNAEKINNKKNAEMISTYYSNLVINVAKKSVLRIDADLKRNICKGCHSLLILGQTTRVRICKKPTHHIRWTCLKCSKSRVYNTKKDYTLWNDNPEAIIDILEFQERKQQE